MMDLYEIVTVGRRYKELSATFWDNYFSDEIEALVYNNSDLSQLIATTV